MRRHIAPASVLLASTLLLGACTRKPADTGVFSQGGTAGSSTLAQGASSAESSARSGAHVSSIASLPSAASSATAANPFFFPVADGHVYRGVFGFAENDGEQDVTLSVQTAAQVKDGVLYHLCFSAVDGVPETRSDLGCFYVTPQRIVRLESENDAQAFASTGALPADAEVVCGDMAVEDALESEEKGWHHTMQPEGDRRVSESYSNVVDTGYYRNMTWQRGVGLVEFESGYGAGRDSLQLTLKT